MAMLLSLVAHRSARWSNLAFNRLTPVASLNYTPVVRGIGRILTILALSSAIGLDWCAFQSIGWAMMLVEHAKHAPFKQALCQTFDGQHPCAICHAVQARKKSEKK